MADPTELESRDRRADHVPVILETPFMPKGSTREELLRDARLKRRYLRACMRDCLLRGEAPFASHGLYTQPGVLRDEVAEERAHGIAAGFAWRARADRTVVYTDLGMSFGMRAGIADCEARGLPHELRQLGPGWEGRCETTPEQDDAEWLWDELLAWLGDCHRVRPRSDDGDEMVLKLIAYSDGYDDRDRPLIGFSIDTRHRRGL